MSLVKKSTIFRDIVAAGILFCIHLPPKFDPMYYRLGFVFVLFYLLLWNTVKCSAQEVIEKAPRDYAIHISYNRLTRKPFAQMGPTGTGVELAHSWQLSGFAGGHRVFITVPLGYRYYFGAVDAIHSSNLYYGWKVRHELKKGNPAWRPFLGYSLLLSQLWLEGREGNILGHETRFTLGADRRLTPKTALVLSLDYSYTRYPQLDVAKAPKAMFLSVKAGIRFCNCSGSPNF